MKKSLLWVAILVLSISMLAVFSLAGCKTTEVTETTVAETTVAETTAVVAETTAAAKVFTILFMPGVADPFYFTMEKGIQKKVAELGASVKLIVAEYPKSWGPEAQVPILEAATAQGGIDLILIAPTSTDALVAPLKKLYDQGIAIITVDTYLGDGDYSKDSDFSFPLSYIGTDNKLGGQQVAENLAKLMGSKGKVYLMNTNPDTSSVVDRGKGFEEGIAKFPDMTLVGTDWCMDVQQKAQELATALFRKTRISQVSLE